MLVTIIILILFFVDSQINTAPRRTVQYVDSWPADRTDAEIVAQQKKDQAEAEARAQSAARKSSRSSRKRSGCERAGDDLRPADDGGGRGAGRCRARPHRAQSQCRLRHRLVRWRDRRPRRDPARRAPPCRSRRARRGRAEGARCDALHHARTLRPCERARPGLRAEHRSRRNLPGSSPRSIDPDPRTAGQGIDGAQGVRGSRSSSASAPRQPRNRSPAFSAGSAAAARASP